MNPFERLMFIRQLRDRPPYSHDVLPRYRNFSPFAGRHDWAPPFPAVHAA
ncbi:hypothetical protein LMG29542_08406 [Paraburkholderia humisilvae]|uniref:Uncharacterized protein n=1 Tax=Paraburkholderia humisilvae TaxID=627669 RepID=A0A6J5F969_9BURK|nr:hypothetical protein LMG29542_08406 [Paraburkholderia humisilvae]